MHEVALTPVGLSKTGELTLLQVLHHRIPLRNHEEVQALVSVPMLRDFCLEPAGPHHLKRGPIGSALQELVQTVYGACIARHVLMQHSFKTWALEFTKASRGPYH